METAADFGRPAHADKLAATEWTPGRAETVDALAFQHAPKSHGEPAHRGELWPVSFQRVYLRDLIGHSVIRAA